MGYAPEYFTSHVTDWFARGWLFPGARLFEFGAQEFFGDKAEAIADIEKFIEARGGKRIEPPIGIADIYRAVAIEHVSIDVDGTPGSIFFDLNTCAPPPEWMDSFDMVNNEGTLEHLTHIVNGFQV